MRLFFQQTSHANSLDHPWQKSEQNQTAWWSHMANSWLEVAMLEAAEEGACASSSHSWFPLLWPESLWPHVSTVSQHELQRGWPQACRRALRRRLEGGRWGRRGCPRLGGEGMDKEQVGLGGRRRGTFGCGLWSSRIGPGSEEIPRRGRHCSERGTMGACDFSGTAQRCSSPGASGSRIGWEWRRMVMKMRKLLLPQLLCCCWGCWWWCWPPWCWCWCWCLCCPRWKCPFPELNPWINVWSLGGRRRGGGGFLLIDLNCFRDTTTQRLKQTTLREMEIKGWVTKLSRSTREICTALEKKQ